MNDADVESRLYAARDAQLRAARMPANLAELVGDRLDSDARERRPVRRAGLLRPVAVGVAVAGVLALSVGLGLPALRGSASPGTHAGTPKPSAAVAPAKRSIACYDRSLPAGTRRLPGTPSAPRPGAPAWDNPGPAFYATLSHDPATLAQQFRNLAIQGERHRTEDGDFQPSSTDLADFNLAYYELNNVSILLIRPDFPASLEPAVNQVFRALAQRPGNRIEVVPGARTNKGCAGTGYTASDVNGIPLRAAVFDQQGNFLGLSWPRH